MQPIITQVQTGATTASQEFIEVFNPTADAITVNGWQLQYVSASGKTTTTLATLSGSLAAQEYMLASFNNYITTADVTFGDVNGSGLLASSAGHVQIVDTTDSVIDCVSWGTTASAIPKCDWSKIAPASNQTLQRPISSNSYDTSLGVVVGSVIPPQAGGLSVPPPSGPVTYPQVQITELLPNPKPPLTDENNEYIELYNPNETSVNLKDYVLQTGENNSYHYTFPSTIIESHQYIAFYSKDTHISLSNTTSRARLLAPNGSEISITPSYTSLAENEAWALIDGQWQATARPTPNDANIASAISTTNSAPVPQTKSVDQCPAGKYRNPATGRCKTLVQSTAPTPCQPGQQRSLITNRCKATSKASTPAIAVCKAGYLRNSTTNRCRKITTPAKSANCKAGYERNAQTNRCRKITLTRANSHPAAENTKSATSKLTAKIILGVIVATIIYGSYEYRTECLRTYLKLKARLPRLKTRR